MPFEKFAPFIGGKAFTHYVKDSATRISTPSSRRDARPFASNSVDHPTWWSSNSTNCSPLLNYCDFLSFFCCFVYNFSFIVWCVTFMFCCDHTAKYMTFICMLVRHIYINFIFCSGFSANFCGYGTQNSKNTKSGIFPKVFNKITWFLVW